MKTRINLKTLRKAITLCVLLALPMALLADECRIRRVDHYAGNSNVYTNKKNACVKITELDHNKKPVRSWTGTTNDKVKITIPAGSNLSKEYLKAEVVGCRNASASEMTVVPVGSRVVMTGVVTAEQPATATVVGPTGAVLAGVVVSVNGEEKVTDAKGRFPIFVGPSVATVAAFLPALLDRQTSYATVVPPVERPSDRAPVVEHTPGNPTPGSQTVIKGSGFEGSAEDNKVTFDDTPVDVLASSPTEMIVAVPADMPVGPRDLTVTTEHGASRPVVVEVTSVWFESADKHLRPGQKGEGFIRISCAEPRTVHVTNLSDVVTLHGGSPLELRTSGGENNGAPISYTANQVGTFHISAEIIDVAPVMFAAFRNPGVFRRQTPRQWLSDKASALAKASSMTANSQLRDKLRAEAKLDQEAADNDANWNANGQPKNKRRFARFLSDELKRLETYLRIEGDGAAADKIKEAIDAAYEAASEAGLSLVVNNEAVGFSANPGGGAMPAAGPSTPRQWLADKARNVAKASSMTQNSQLKDKLRNEAKLDQSTANNDANWNANGQPKSKKRFARFLSDEIKRLEKYLRIEGKGQAADRIKDAIGSAYEAAEAAGLKLK